VADDDLTSLELKAVESPHPAYKGFLHAGNAFISYASITLVGTALGGVIAIVDEVLIARFLGVSTYGRYALAYMLARIGSIVAAFGLPATILHFLPLRLSQGRREQALGSIIGGLALPVIFGGAFAVMLRLLGTWFALSVFHEPQAVIYIHNLMFLAPLIAITEVLGHIARGFGRALHYVLIRNLAPPLFYLWVLLYLSYSHGPKIAVTYGLVGGYIFSSLLGFACIAKFVWSTIGVVKPQFELREMYSYAFTVLATVAISLGLVWTDLFQLGIFTNANTVGIYRACMQIVFVFDVIGLTFMAAVGPIYPVLISERRDEQLRNTYLAAVHLAALLATPIFLLILVNAQDLLGILGTRFTVGASALGILAFGSLLKVCFGTAAVLLILGGRQRLEAVNVAVTATLNIVLNMHLIPRFGLVGAASSTTISLLVLSALRLLEIPRAFPAASLDLGIFRVLVTVPVAIVASRISIICGFGPNTGVRHLMLRTFGIGLLICVTIWLVCLSEGERIALRNLLTLRRGARGSAGSAASPEN